MFGLVETGRILVEVGNADINATTKSGETPLHLCAEKGKQEFVEFLLTLPTLDKQKLDKSNPPKTAYDVAVASGHKEVGCAAVSIRRCPFGVHFSSWCVPSRVNLSQIAAMLKPPSSGGCCVIL